MRFILTLSIVLLSLFSYSQERYYLYLDKDTSTVTYFKPSSLTNISQLYLIERSDSTFTLYNKSLKFSYQNDTTVVSFLNEVESTYKTTIWVRKGFWYILCFHIGDSKVYYFFYRELN